MTPPSEEQELLLDKARLIKSVAHPVRLELLREMAPVGNCGPHDLPQVRQLSPFTLQQHLRELKKAGIINGRIYGQTANYSINWEKLEELAGFMKEFVAEIKNLSPSD